MLWLGGKLMLSLVNCNGIWHQIDGIHRKLDWWWNLEYFSTSFLLSILLFPLAGHVHTGNMVIENNVCRLLDLENQVVGLPNQLRGQVIYHRRINSIEALDVYGFGHALYEMLFQKRLEADTCEDFPPQCSPMPSELQKRKIESWRKYLCPWEDCYISIDGWGRMTKK